MRVVIFALLILSAFCIPPLPAGPFRGVNIGGWLVLESWITPDLYSNNSVPVSHPLLPGAPPSNGPGEYGFTKLLGKDRAKAVLEKHWDSWVQRADLATLAASGINWIRVPVGYWIVDIAPDEPFVPGGMFYLRRLLGWAHELGISVLVDIHAAPGSQNGHDNSGRTGPIRWNTPENINRTVHVLSLLAQEIGDMPSVGAIELLNEPWTPAVGGSVAISTLKAFYQRAHDTLRAEGFEKFIVFSDGFSPDSWDGFLAPQTYQNVLIDTHLYRCFGGGNLEPYDNIQSVCEGTRAALRSYTHRDWTIVGEYSLCLTNSTLATPPAPSSPWFRFASFYAAAQMTSFGSGVADGPPRGSFFWNFKISDAATLGVRREWDFLYGLSQGYMPQSPFAWEQNGCP